MVISKTPQVQRAPVPERRGGRRSTLPVVAFVAASVVSGLLNLGFQRFFGADLDEDARGALRSILAALAGFGFFATGLQVAFATMIEARGNVVASRAHLRTFALATAAGSAAVALVAGIGWLPMGSDRWVVAPLIAAYVLLSAGSALPRARLLIGRRWADLAGVIVLSSALKFAGAVVAREVGATLTVALLGLVVSEGAALVLAQKRAQRVTRPLADADSGGPNSRSLVVALAALSGLWALTGLDSVIARVSLPSAAADSYSASSSVARLAFFAPAVVAWLSLPDFIERGYGNVALRRTLARALWAVGLISVATAGLVIAVPTQLRRLVAGDSDELSVAATRWLAGGWALFSLASLFVFFHVAQRSRLALLPWGGAVVVGLGALAVGDEPTRLAVVVLVGAGLTAVVLIAPALTRVQPVTHAIQATPQRQEPTPRAIRDVTIVVPCYNPGVAVVETLHRIARSLRPAVESFEIIAVTDGSTDDSPDLIDTIDEEWLRHIRCERNGGKGKALRTGFAHAHAGIIGFIDADGDLPPEQLPLYLDALVTYRADAVLGSKRHPDSHLEVPFHRAVYSWGYQRLVRLLFRLDIRDTQTGIKLFRRELIEQALPLLDEEGFALDLELFVVARAIGFRNLVEMPVRLEHQYNSTISNRSAMTMLVSTLRIFWRSRFSLTYVRKLDAFGEGSWEVPTEGKRRPATDQE